MGMTFGTGPQALTETIATNWDPTRTGRPDVPDVPRDGSGNALYGADAQRAEAGTVLVVDDRETVANNQGVHDLVHCYHPQQTGISFTDRGYAEQSATETVQIDIETTDRTDPDTGERVSAKTTMVDDRDDAAFSTDIAGGPYPGILGEVLYVLGTVTRKGFAEYDVARKEVIDLQLYNSNAAASVSVDLEWLSIDTA